MISEVSRGLRGAGIDPARIHFELFGASAADAQAAAARHQARARQFGGTLCAVTVKADGRETRLELAPDGENILDAALAAGVDLPFACKGGACATCKAKLVRGEVEMDVRHALEDADIAAGYILSCQAHPVSAEVVIDFDQAV
jgi:ring-1,2-phenylacetyl-CoA epoxidase subunit PaaE